MLMRVGWVCRPYSTANSSHSSLSSNATQRNVGRDSSFGMSAGATGEYRAERSECCSDQ